MKCKDCEHFKIIEQALNFGLELWEMGTVVCDKYNLEKAFHNRCELELLECVGGAEEKHK